MNIDAKIYVAGHKGLVGTAILKKLQEQGYKNIVIRSHDELDLLDQHAVNVFFEKEKPEYVFLAAAKVGGIKANNSFPANFIYDNLQIELNVIHFSYTYKVKQLLFLGSSCIYPRMSAQPIKEGYLLSGYLEPTNEPYAVSKIAGIKMCESYNRQYGTDFRSVMPTNLYGPEDNFNLETSHVLPALMRKFDDAKLACEDAVVIWGSGMAKREFLYVDDMADACVYLMKLQKNTFMNVISERCSHINIGTGTDLSISELAEMIREVVGCNIKIKYNTKIPDGTPKKVLNIDRLAKLGWTAKTTLREGLIKTYAWYQDNKDRIKI